MKKTIINQIQTEMSGILNNAQRQKLSEVLEHCFFNLDVVALGNENLIQSKSNLTLKEEFLSAKQVEGCSERSVNYYSSTLDNLIKNLEKPFNQIETEDLRIYLSEYQKKNNASKQTIDNIRRILSSFFTWLEDEDYILKSPVRRIHKIKTMKQIKETYSDEAVERLRDNCKTIRDLALIDMLASTGMRVGELVKLNRVDVDFVNRECVVLGKGSKERVVYFDARTKLHLQNVTIHHKKFSKNRHYPLFKEIQM